MGACCSNPEKPYLDGNMGPEQLGLPGLSDGEQEIRAN